MTAISAKARRINTGRPRTSSANAHGGRIAVRLVMEPELRRTLNDLAIREDVSLSEIVRRACREYIE